ncbi:MAG: tetratricopeptide repeat protein [Bacteroidia bacterium]|nr:tetratricopeptide repeat protein [Bacteroidia bacterium]NNF32417.1 tetratricopeptide repeat protein [Flavobacteriaceae bacterium]NNK55457.1 tetratricopeptide repeat protein [Flavobacteriaceae bacterium]
MKTIATYIVVALVMQPLFLMYCQNNTDDIIKAYDLRMDGRTEEAITVLSEIIDSDPSNAMAHFELARSLENDKKNDHIIMALDYDPENLAYKFYQANLQMLEAYKGMKTNNKELITNNLDLCKETLKSILAIKPDCKESLFFLIDIYGSIPEDMGGNIDMAEKYLKTLKDVDPLYAAHGELILKFKDGDVDMVKYWKDYIATIDDSNEAHIKLGKAYLMNNDMEKAKECFNTVMKSDPNQTILHLDVARAHLYTAMRGGDKSDEALQKFKENIQLYIDAEIKKPKLIEAWCYGWLGMVESRQGNKELADMYAAKAEKLIPNYPRFTAIPSIDAPPNVKTYKYKSYFSPF